MYLALFGDPGTSLVVSSPGALAATAQQTEVEPHEPGQRQLEPHPCLLSHYNTYICTIPNLGPTSPHLYKVLFGYIGDFQTYL